jgi:outer membrane receptor protein involved in Fe transport
MTGQGTPRRHLLALHAFLMTTALAAPACAQEIETVIVSAEKKAEDVQTVPIAVSAFTSQDLQDHQIEQFKDLQFDTPNVNYTKTNFTASNFQIRGIGTQIISTDSEFGVAFNVDDVYYATPPVDSSQFYDLQDVEVLRGPQSTLYGRGATGGAVNVTTAKPNLDEYAANGWASYGNYNAAEIRGMVNLPVIQDQLGIRIAGDWVRHDGFTNNIYPGAADADGRNMWSMRASIRWQPSESTTVDLIASRGDEADTRMRAQKQFCDTDPTGILGCLPNARSGGSGAVNLNATFLAIPVSKQALGLAFTPLYTQLYEQQGYSPAVAATLGAATAPGLGITDLSSPFTAPPGAVPSDPHTINSDVNPTMRNRSNTISLHAQQKVGDWLNATFVANYADFNLLSQESFVNSPGQAFSPVQLATSVGTFQQTIGLYALAGIVPPTYASATTGPYAFILNPSHAGSLPTSNFTNLGIIGGSINRYTSNEFAYDQSDGQGKQSSFELRFASDLPGPFNFLAAAYYLHADSPTDYYVGANTLDYGQALIGALKGPLPTALGGAGPLCANSTGCIFGPPYYHNDGALGTIDSKAVYGEVYYDVVPDTLKLTGGLRYTEDLKHYDGRIAVFDGVIPVGTTDENGALANLVAQGQTDFDGAVPGNQLYEMTKSKYDKLTGRAVATYTPKVDFTDATMVYMSYSRGYKAGGANPGIDPNNLAGIPTTYAPESIDAYELGTKNTLAGGTLQANLTLWHYDYYNYQISQIIANTSVNTNVNAKLSGLEAEFKIAASERLSFNLNAALTNSALGNSYAVDTRNPTGGNPNTLLIKDGTLSPTQAENCVLYYNGSNFGADFAALQSLSQGLFYAPPGGSSALAGAGVAHSAYGTCYGGSSAADPFYALSVKNPAIAGLLAGTHFSTSNPAINGTLTGVPVSLKGRRLALVSPGSISFGAQYAQPLEGGYSLVGRADWYWQAAMFGQIFNDPADRIPAYGVGNLQLTLVAPEKDWQVQGFVRNVFNSDNMTGEYLAAPTQGLFTGAFYGDPRLYGVAVSVNY